MGISGLLPFLKTKACLKAFESWPPGSKVAIDVPIFAHKFIYAERSYGALERRFLRFAEDLKASGAVPIFVFDGAKLELKNAERQRRAVARDRQLERHAMKVSEALEAQDPDLPQVVAPEGGPPIFEGLMFPTKKEYLELAEALKAYDVRTAQFEAEALCAHLTTAEANFEAWCVLTEDTDALAFGAVRVVFRYFSEPIVVEMDHVLASLEFTRSQFIDFCMLQGCDFCHNVYYIGPIASYDLLKKHGSWPEAYKAVAHCWRPKTQETALEFQSKYDSVRECFETRAFENK